VTAAPGSGDPLLPTSRRDVVGRRHVIAVGRERRRFLEVTGRSSAADVPLVLVFHGALQTIGVFRWLSSRTFEALAARGRARIVYLEGRRGGWNDPRRSSPTYAHRHDVDDAGFVEAVLTSDRFPSAGDGGPAYAIGFSNGGDFVIRLLHERPDLLAGAALIAALQPVPDDLCTSRDGVEPLPTPLPTLLIHGTADPIVPYHGGPASWWGFRPRGEVLSAVETAAYFAARNGIVGAPKTFGTSATGAPVTLTAFEQPHHPPVWLCTVHGGGHAVPGGKAVWPAARLSPDIDAADLVAMFFAI
jgi:polyhydroxybutyrate depolymerase